MAARPGRLAATVALLVVTLVACATSKNAVATENYFTFVAPGGQTRIFYDPPASRGTVRGLSGDSLLEPGHTIGIDDFTGQVVVLNIWGSWCGPCRAEAPGLEHGDVIDFGATTAFARCSGAGPSQSTSTISVRRPYLSVVPPVPAVLS